ncbi:hypothetical protein E0485_01780 [Paenibacillus albiflavus]|uniref:YprB ribonuclease H-like domain-containing protein n=1 Tax=Paenibacillus albiflavus TaxID=2545760 RepID=A0A4R4ER79_9BACL|nr:ribonuclease H-like domain-containing protein [Paenibacillus albiflavus]TCZ81035.1 hypothetical protein E0485_01780 [Paenibacillus albiflavus]
MSSVRERLLRHKQASTKSVTSSSDEPISRVNVQAETLLNSTQDERTDTATYVPALEPAWSIIGAELSSNTMGSFLLRRKSFSLSEFQGIYRLGELMTHASELIAFHDDKDSDQFTERSMLFLDTETTGLGIGAGNVPFMIGIGYYEQDAFVVEQLFIRNPAEELAMLHYLQTLVQQFTHLVTYNGRTFDWPLIVNRFILNRLSTDSHELKHIDLLHPSRSLWKNTLPTCKLSQVEVDRLGVLRYDDVPGSLAPALYFQYLAEGNPTILHGVFKHNEQDIVTLASLVIHFGKLLSGTLDLSLVPLEEQFRSALWLAKMNKHDLADEYLDHIWQELLYGAFSDEGHSVWRGDLPLRLASCYKQKHEHQRAVALWHRWIDTRSSGLPTMIQPYIELAIYYEHRERNYDKALSLSNIAYNMLRKRRTLRRSQTVDSVEELDLKKRMERLRTKSQKLGNARKQ